MRRRIGVICAGVVALATIAAGLTPWPLSPSRVAKGLNAGMGASQPLIWEAPRAATFSALPWPNVRIVDARLDDPLGLNLISAPTARIDLSLLDLLAGRLAPKKAAFAAPTMTFDLDRPPFALKGSLTNAVMLVYALRPLASLSLSDGVLEDREQGPQNRHGDRKHAGGLAGLVPGKPLSVNLLATWRGAPLKIFLSLADPVLTATGSPSDFSAALSSPLADFALNGSLAGGARFGLAGDFSASSPSLSALARLLGWNPPSFLATDDIRIAGTMKATPTALALDEATATTAGQTVRGALEISGLEQGPRFRPLSIPTRSLSRRFSGRRRPCSARTATGARSHFPRPRPQAPSISICASRREVSTCSATNSPMWRPLRS